MADGWCLYRRCEQLTQALEELNTLREQDESHASQLNDVAATQKKQLIAVKKRLLALDKNTSVLRKKLVQREANMIQTQHKFEHLQERLQVTTITTSPKITSKLIG